jgi:transposase
MNIDIPVTPLGVWTNSSGRILGSPSAHTLAVFRACLSRRGRKGEDDGRFLEALHFFTVENARRRALPKEFGNWNSVWKRFDRLSKAGVFEAFFDMLASLSASAHLLQMFDSTIVCAHVSAAGAKRGQEGQALGRSRGGFTRKIHAKSDRCGNLIAFDLTGGQALDVPHVDVFLDIGPDIEPRAAIAEKGYSSKANRASARARGIVPVIPHKVNEKDKPTFFAKIRLYKARADRTRLRTPQTLQAGRPSMRKNRPQLQIHHQLCHRTLLDQIRPHGLELQLIAVPELGRGEILWSFARPFQSILWLMPSLRGPLETRLQLCGATAGRPARLVGCPESGMIMPLRPTERTVFGRAPGFRVGLLGLAAQAVRDDRRWMGFQLVPWRPALEQQFGKQ